MTVRDGAEPQHEGIEGGAEGIWRTQCLAGHSLSDLWGGLGGPPVESWGGFRAHVSWSLEGAVIVTRGVASAGVPDLRARTALPRDNNRVPGGSRQ